MRGGARFLGADVKLSAVSTCTDIIKMPNPALWFASGCVTGLSPFAKVRPGVLVLDVVDATYAALDEHSIIDVGGSFYRYNPRFALSDNSLKSPSWVAQRCIGRNGVNEDSCRAPNFSLSGTVLSGLRVEVYKSDGGVFFSELVGTDAQRYNGLADSEVDHPSTFPFCHWHFHSLELFGNCRGRSSSPFWDSADRDLGSPNFFVHMAASLCDRLVKRMSLF